MTVHTTHHVPAVGLEALGRVVGEPAFHVTVDGDAVVVPEGDQLAQAQGTGQGTGLVGDTFHHATIAHEHIGVVVDDVVAVTVELAGQRLFGDGHTHGIGDALAQGTGGGFHARGVAVFGMAGGLGVQLAEVLQLFHGQVVARQVQQGVDEHGAMAVGQDETVTVEPLGVVGVVLEETVPQHLGDVRHSHGGARMAGLCLLHRIHAQGTDGIGEFFTRGH